MSTVTQHKVFDTISTETETTPPGSFVALVSTYGTDRVGDKVTPGAFAASLERWRESGKMIPVLAHHDGVVGAVVGHIDPRLTHETEQGLEATGHLDTSTELGQRVYELVKQGSLAWSIGYTVPKGGKRKGKGVTELTEVDLIEVSAVTSPANEGTRTLSIKAEQPVQLVSFEL